MLDRITIKLDAYRRLGITNLLRVVKYRLALKSGWLKLRQPKGEGVSGNFFELPNNNRIAINANNSEGNECGSVKLFGYVELPLHSPPDWHRSVLNGKSITETDLHWADYSDFSLQVGDIKGVWEASRFTWVLAMTRALQGAAQPCVLDNLNSWLSDWSKHNPVNTGVNWKCAQEASIRVMHLAASAMLMQQSKPGSVLAEMVEQHLSRITPTLGYAKAQDNNHGTSEAVALYIGGSWLCQRLPNHASALRWHQLGKRYIEERVNSLILPDGSFSQYSTNYHRLMLDSINLMELWRRFVGLPAFSPHFYQKLQLASEWLYRCVDQQTGDVPNLGANDGAHILNYLNTDYRDFRPSAELACQLFCNLSVFPHPYGRLLAELFNLPSVPVIQHQNDLAVMQSPETLAIARTGSARAYMRLPRCRFRPGQADVLHLDFWLGSTNLLRDGGSFSYNCSKHLLEYFSGISSHNAIQVDNRQPMPKVSRFLFGRWPACEDYFYTEEKDRIEFGSGYTDYCGTGYHRSVTLLADRLIVVDSIRNFGQTATLRWRLCNANWQQDGDSLHSEYGSIQVTADVPVSRMALENGEESRYYGRKQVIPVLEIDVQQDAQITTIMHWN